MTFSTVNKSASAAKAAFMAFSLLVASCSGGSTDENAAMNGDGGAPGDVECVLADGACPGECVQVRASLQLGPDEQCYVAEDVLIGCLSADKVPEHEGGCPGIAPGCIESPEGIRYIEGSCQPRLEGFVDCDAETYYDSSQAECESE